MAGVPLECVLMLRYALSLGLIALLLEPVSRLVQRRSVGFSTAGFTYHPDKDIWRCPRDQYLVPVFSDCVKGTGLKPLPEVPLKPEPPRAPLHPQLRVTSSPRIPSVAGLLRGGRLGWCESSPLPFRFKACRDLPAVIEP